MRVVVLLRIAYATDIGALLDSLSDAASSCLLGGVPTWLGCPDPPIAIAEALASGGDDVEADAFEISDQQLDDLCGGFCEYDKQSMDIACEDLLNDPADELHILAAILKEFCTPCGKVMIVPLFRRLIAPPEGETGQFCLQPSDPCRAGMDDNLPLCGDHLEAQSPGCKQIMVDSVAECTDPETSAAWDLIYGIARDQTLVCYSDHHAALKYAANCELPASAPASFIPIDDDFVYTPLDQCPPRTGPNCTLAPTPAPTPAAATDPPTPPPTPEAEVEDDPDVASSEAASALFAGLVLFFVATQ
jgi:hypothetical protein